MTNTMECLFDYLNEEEVGDYLEVDGEYRVNSARTDQWSLDLRDHLDAEGKELFDRYQQAAFLEHHAALKAMFQATVKLCRELNGVL